MGLPLATTQFSQTLLPYRAEANFDLQPLGKILTLRGLELREVSWQKLSKDSAKISTWGSECVDGMHDVVARTH